ncbi:hypothetical protein [Vibrio sp. ER1A]|uniref:hypothetical protein n=1 Tax=Vibrio sp. ER1A TaxID=1517681 RepID=UPI0004DCC4D3|nr:hypothetical protein [Vibrio sp. ER1A]KFA99463.1 hypothetical protein HW45_03635 [Vibrio sp. ER1A]
MNQLELTTQELLIQESAQSRAHKQAQSMLEQGVEVNVASVITAALAKAIPHIKDQVVQTQVTQMLVEAAGVNLALNSNLEIMTKRVAVLEQENQNQAASLVECPDQEIVSDADFTQEGENAS